jgi:hypothetical protein
VEEAIEMWPKIATAEPAISWESTSKQQASYRVSQLHIKQDLAISTLLRRAGTPAYGHRSRP